MHVVGHVSASTLRFDAALGAVRGAYTRASPMRLTSRTERVCEHRPRLLDRGSRAAGRQLAMKRRERRRAASGPNDRDAVAGAQREVQLLRPAAASLDRDADESAPVKPGSGV